MSKITFRMSTESRTDDKPYSDRAGDVASAQGIETITRDQVQDRIRSARTPEQIAAAWNARDVWLRDHPDDNGIYDEGEALFMREEALKRMAKQIKKSEMVA